MADQQRTVTIHKMDGFDLYMRDFHGETAFQNALGYLVQWNMWEGQYDTVTLRCSVGGPNHGGYEQPSILAVYTKTKYTFTNNTKSAEVERQFVIAAIFHPQQSATDEHNGRLASFSFHS